MANTTTTATYTITEKAQIVADRVTLQRPAPGMGKAWRTAGYKAPSLRHQAIAAIAAAANGQPFTAEQAMAALGGVPLGSGTPNSFVKAFIACGYLAPAKAAAKGAK
jgi:hypothetical protein